MTDVSKAPDIDGGANDFYVELVAYNRHIMHKLVELGMTSGDRGSVTELIEKMGYGFGFRKAGKELEVRNLVGLKTIPVESDGTWKPIVIEMAKALKTEPESLFPGRLKTNIPPSNSRRLETRIGEPIQWLIM